jgi:hypothetical protein
VSVDAEGAALSLLIPVSCGIGKSEEAILRVIRHESQNYIALRIVNAHLPGLIDFLVESLG